MEAKEMGGNEMERTAADFKALGAWARATDPTTFNGMAREIGSRSVEKVGRAIAAADPEQADRFWEEEGR